MSANINETSLDTLCAALTYSMGIDAPQYAAPKNVELTNYIDKVFNGEKADRIVMYNPDAVAEWIYRKYPDYFKNVKSNTEKEIYLSTVMPSVTPVCFGTMYSGAQPSVHGIQKYVKPLITIDSLFDSWARSGLKVAMVAVAGQSIPKIFAERNIDYYLMPYDKQVVEKALELIKEDKYDVIEVYNQEYDDVMHLSHPQSFAAKRAARHYVESFDKLMNAVDEHWQSHDTFVAFSTDHGTHRMFFGLGPGMHGSNIPKDRNIVHFYGVKPKKK